MQFLYRDLCGCGPMWFNTTIETRPVDNVYGASYHWKHDIRDYGTFWAEKINHLFYLKAIVAMIATPLYLTTYSMAFSARNMLNSSIRGLSWHYK